ncbi:DMT family transporter [Mesorhizobium xinjiangense]|uniref:DMT family transporter n=1 Tax=Mesorhizobium xinjiangense TaxID=2678685 RepID=UPI0012EE6D22|nr:DMT family transporter [Mesorhizobium xinjiangense]
MNRQAYVLLMLTTLMWGGNAVAGKLAVGHVSPMLLTAARWGFACVGLSLIGWRQLAKDWAVVRAHMPTLAGLGIVGFSAFNIALYSALNYTTAVNVSIEQAGIPMLIFAANFIFFRLRVSAGQIVGFFLSLAGIALTASNGDPLQLLRLDVNAGDALMLLAITVYAGYTVALRFRPQIHWQSFMIVLSASACLFTIPFAVIEYWTGATVWPSTQGWGVIAYTAIFPSLLAQIFYVRGVELIGPNRAGLFINLVPVFGTLLAIVVIGEPFRPYHGAALALVMGGIWLAEWSGRKMG